MSAKQKIVHGRGLSNLNLGIFVCSFDVCRASKPVHSINYALIKRVKFFRLIFFFFQFFAKIMHMQISVSIKYIAAEQTVMCVHPIISEDQVF